MPINTKEILARKYLEISSQKSIDRISVKELVCLCGISRQAFYYHFQDIFEVAAYANELRVREILAASHDTNNLSKALFIFISFFSENLTTTKKQLESQKYRQFESLLNQMIRMYLKELVRKSTQTFSPSDLDASIEFCTGGVYHMLMTKAGKSPSEDAQLAEQLAQLIKGEIALF